MQMIDVLKRLQELDANNPNIVKEDDANSKMITDLQNISAPSIDQFVDNDKQETLESLEECGMMGDMNKPHTPASINMTADSGEELAHMLKDIMSLAGVRKVEPADLGIEPEPAVMRADPSLGKASDNGDMRRMLDTLNDEEVTEMDNEPTEEIMGNMEDDALLSGKHARPGGEPGAAKGRAQANNPHAYPNESATYESLMADYRKFVSESEEQSMEEGDNRNDQDYYDDKFPGYNFPENGVFGYMMGDAEETYGAHGEHTAEGLHIVNRKTEEKVHIKDFTFFDEDPTQGDLEDLFDEELQQQNAYRDRDYSPNEFEKLRALHQKLSARGNPPASSGGFDPTKP